MSEHTDEKPFVCTECKTKINYRRESSLVTKCHIWIRSLLPSASSRHVYRLKITISAIKTVYYISVVVSVKYIVLLLVLVIIKYLNIVYTTHIVYRVYGMIAIKTVCQILSYTHLLICAIVTVYKMCVIAIVKYLELVYTYHIGCKKPITSAIVTLIQMCAIVINEYLKIYIVHTACFKSDTSDNIKVYHLCSPTKYKNLVIVHTSHLVCTCLQQMHISPNLMYVNNVAKNNVKAYLLHISLSILLTHLASELCPTENLLARYHTNREIMGRKRASKIKKSHKTKLSICRVINIITYYISNITTLYQLQA